MDKILDILKAKNVNVDQAAVEAAIQSSGKASEEISNQDALAIADSIISSQGLTKFQGNSAVYDGKSTKKATKKGKTPDFNAELSRVAKQSSIEISALQQAIKEGSDQFAINAANHIVDDLRNTPNKVVTHVAKLAQSTPEEDPGKFRILGENIVSAVFGGESFIHQQQLDDDGGSAA